MERTDWAEVKKRLKQAMDQGVKVLKEGGQGARYVAGQTAHLLQLEMDIYGLKSGIAKTTAELGEAVYKSLKGGKLQTTSDIKRLIDDLDTLNANLKKTQSEAQKMPLTRQAPRPAASPKKRKKTD